jgi:hypothetical protein
LSEAKGMGINMKSEAFKDFEELEALSYEKFDINSSIEFAKNVLDKYSKESKFNDCKMENEIWRLHNQTEKVNRTINFSELSPDIPALSNKVDLEYKTLIKCWAATLIDNGLSAAGVCRSVKNLIKFMVISNYFSIHNLEESLLYINNKTERPRNELCNSILNFLDYYSIADLDGEYTGQIWLIKSKINVLIGIRDIPNSHDILKFSMVVEDYFRRELSDHEYRKYLPIYLWWNITTIIPLRISEFCDINRRRLPEEKDGYYLKLPRKKQNDRRIQVIDQILIPKDLGESINKYIERTEIYGKSSTLISYKSIPKSNLFDSKIDKNSFHSTTMRNLLNDFYEKVVFKQYGFKHLDEKINVVESDPTNKIINRKIRANDTRHFAFLNLMTQGYHPVEIARLGGHVSIYSQYHYHQHLEYWVDSEVMELMLKFNIKKKIGQQKNELYDEKDFKERFILRPAETNTKIPLRTGYCTDPNQNCMVDDHVFCDYWRITFDEYKEKANEIAAKINQKEERIKELLNNLKGLYEICIKGSKNSLNSETNFIFNKELTENAKQLKHSLYQLAMLKEKVNFQ